MVGRKLPKPFNDPSTGLMNVPKSVKNLSASGVKLNIDDGFKAGRRGIKSVTKKNVTLRGLGRKEGRQLTARSRKRATR